MMHDTQSREWAEAERIEEALSAYRGGDASPLQGEAPTDEAKLLQGLLELEANTRPDPAFVDALERRLKRAAQEGQSAPQRQRIGVRNRRLWGAMAAAGVIIAVLALTLPAWLQERRSIQAALPSSSPDNAAVEAPSPSAAAIAMASPQSAKPTPTSASVSTAGPTTTPTERATAEPTPTVEPIALAALPPLPAELFSGLGGAGLQPLAAETLQWRLDASLPETPAQMTVYMQQAPAPLSAELAEQTARRLGLQPSLYTPWPLEAGQALADAVYVAAVDEPRQIIFENAMQWTYSLGPRSPLHVRCWQPGDPLPDREQARDAAERLLDAAGVLPDRYDAELSGNSISFYRLIDGEYRLHAPAAVASVCSDGQIGGLVTRDVQLVPVRDYRLMPAAEAWELLQSGQLSGRGWIRTVADALPWGEAPSTAVRYWTREFRPGQRVDLFAGLQVQHPVETGGELRVLMAGLRLRGDLTSLVEAQRSYVESTGNVEAPLHVWGVVEDGGGYLSLNVEGWEVVEAQVWSGVVRRVADDTLLELPDGLALLLPDAPADLPDGTEIFALGGRLGDQLAWHLLQEATGDTGRPPAPPAGAAGVEVFAVALVYVLPGMEIVAQDPSADLAWRVAQPAYHFRGYLDNGRVLEAFVQAAVDARR